jgi:hypothetical protein
VTKQQQSKATELPEQHAPVELDEADAADADESSADYAAEESNAKGVQA